MVEVVLAVSNQVLHSAERVARQTQQPIEAVLSAWLDRTAAELPVEDLDDEELVALCNLELPPQSQAELTTLLEGHREGTLDESARAELERRMDEHDRLLLRKSQALREGVRRGLRAPLAA